MKGDVWESESRGFEKEGGRRSEREEEANKAWSCVASLIETYTNHSFLKENTVVYVVCFKLHPTFAVTKETVAM